MSLFKNKFKIFIQKIVFYWIFLTACLIPAIPFRISFLPAIFPSFATMIVFNFFVLRKERMSYAVLFVFALIYDALNYSLLGSTMLTWLISIKIMDYLRTKLLISKDFILILRDFALFNFLNLALQWTIISFEHKISYPVFLLFKQFLLDIVIYVLIYSFLKKLENFYDA